MVLLSWELLQSAFTTKQGLEPLPWHHIKFNSLHPCEHFIKALNESLPCDVLDSTFFCDDNILVVSEQALVDPIIDRIDSSSKVNLCPPNVGTCSLKEGTFSCNESDTTLVDPMDDHFDSSRKISLYPPSVGINDLNEYLHHSTISYFSPMNLESVILEDKGANWVKKGVLDPCSWISFPFDPGNDLNYGTCLVVIGQDDKNNLEEFVGTFPYDGMFFLRVYNPLEAPTLCTGKGSSLTPFFTISLCLDSRKKPFQEGEFDNNMDSMDCVKALEEFDGHKIKKYNVWKVHLSEKKEERGHLCKWSSHNFKNSQKKTTKQGPYLIKETSVAWDIDSLEVVVRVRINLCPASADTYALNVSSLFCNDCVDQPVCKCSSLVEGSCNVIKEPQGGGTNDNVDQMIRSDSLSISIVGDPIACFAHRDHYSILYEDNEISTSDVPSGVSHESSIVLDNYTCYNNPLWCEAFPPIDGNLFLEDESTLLENECFEEQRGVCFPITSSSWFASIFNVMLGQDDRYHLDVFVDTFPYDGKSFLRVYNPLEEPTLCMGKNTLDVPSVLDTFLNYLLAYDDTHTCVGCISYVSSGISKANESLLDSMLCKPLPFDPGVVFKCVECGSNIVCYFEDSSFVLLLDLMCLNEASGTGSITKLTGGAMDPKIAKSYNKPSRENTRTRVLTEPIERIPEPYGEPDLACQLAHFGSLFGPTMSTGNAVGCPSSSNALTPIKIDGWEEDVFLSRSKLLHRVEVFKRRNRRTKQLHRIYRDCYWSLMDEVKLKHREYCWKFGMSVFQEDEENSNKVGTLETGENNGNVVISSTGGVHGYCRKGIVWLLCEVKWSRSKTGHLGCTIPNLATTSLLSSYSCRLMHVTYKNLKDFTVIQLNLRPSILLWLDETNVVARHRCILEC
ncbi:hypothetical protein MTR67_039165 [Solanum verrucosum]|uniref:Uncharacterized protein n=1 Tax=Solanum verrucosum TaxID=315347 RepID=A0AAF0UHC8_SOLVR|nr:hypothetical protein MTR67_039165 [Solanum verrucosum]